MRKGRYHSHKCVSLLCDPCSFSGAVPPETAPLTGCSPHSGKRRCNPTPSHVPSGGITNGVCAIKQVTARPPPPHPLLGAPSSALFCSISFLSIVSEPQDSLPLKSVLRTQQKPQAPRSRTNLRVSSGYRIHFQFSVS